MRAPEGKYCVQFPGQGAQYAGMARRNCDEFPEAAAVFEIAREVLGFDLLALCSGGPEEELHRTDVSQPAILASSAASLAAYRASGADTSGAWAACGLSLGEYTALYFAGALDLADALRLVRARGTYMQEACDLEPSGMTSIIGLERERVEEIVGAAGAAGVLAVANVNAPNQIVVSGALAALEEAARLAEAAGATQVVPLKVAGAFHSPLMEPARARLAAELERTEIRDPAIPVVSNVTARPVTTAAEARDALVRQLTAPVLWSDSIAWLAAQEVAHLLEIGPGRVLTGLLRRIDRRVTGTSIDVVKRLER